MRYTNLSAQMRVARTQKALSQAQLAERSGTSRVSIARFEAGADQDFRLGTLTRLCDALDLELTAVTPGAQRVAETGLARAQEKVQRLERRHRHAVLAARLLTSPRSRALALIAQARANVERWEYDHLCSEHYIARWRRMLAGRIGRVARSLLRDDEWADALFQNSPWAFALEPAPE